MAITIVLANGTELSPTTASSTHVTYQGASRAALEFAFAEDVEGVSFDRLNTLFTEINCSTIKLIDGEKVNQYTGYVLNVGIKLVDVQVSSGDNETPPTYERRLIVTMAQRTLLENQIRDLQSGVDQAMLVSLGAI